MVHPRRAEQEAVLWDLSSLSSGPFWLIIHASGFKGRFTIRVSLCRVSEQRFGCWQHLLCISPAGRHVHTSMAAEAPMQTWAPTSGTNFEPSLVLLTLCSKLA